MRRNVPLLVTAGLVYGLWITPATAQNEAPAPEAAAAPEATAEEAVGEAEAKAALLDGASLEEPLLRADASGKVVLTDAMVEKLSARQLERVLQGMSRPHRDSSEVTDVVVPVFFFLLLAFVVGLPLYLGFRKDRLRQETLRLMVEKGAEIPAELLTPPARPRRSDLRTGLILISAGLGLIVFLAAVSTGDSPGLWSVGAVPALIGCGYIAAWKLESGRNGGSR